jgi:DNA-directed RNA polymerase specialized sigma subunit
MDQEFEHSEEWKLFLKLRNGDDSVIERLIELWEDAIVSVARQHANRGLPFEVLYKAGKESLVNLAKSECGSSHRELFFSFGVWCIRQGIMVELESKGLL